MAARATETGPAGPGMPGTGAGWAWGAPLLRVSTPKLVVLRRLAERPMTAAELARAMGVHRSAVHRHLLALQQGGLVLRGDSGRKWVYYALSPRGRALAAGPPAAVPPPPLPLA